MSTVKARRRTLLRGIALITIARAAAAEAGVRVACANGFRPAMTGIAGEFSGVVEVDYAEGAVLAQRLAGGAKVDVVILPRSILDPLALQGIVVPQSVADLAATDVLGIAVRSGAAKPKAETAEAFRRWLLGLKSIALTDPALAGGASRQFQSTIEQLGIAEEMKRKVVLTQGGSANTGLVTSGKAEAAVQLSHLLRAVDGLALVAVPPEFRGTVSFAAGMVAGTPDRAAAETLIDFLKGPVAARAIEASGMRRMS